MSRLLVVAALAPLFLVACDEEPSTYTLDPLTGPTTSGPTTSGTMPVTGLLAASWSFGECMGICLGELVLEESELSYTVTDWENNVSYTNTATFEPLGIDALNAAVGGLVGLTLEPVYGCPDCADGGASDVTIVRDEVISTHEYEHGLPPAELVELDDWVTAVMDELATCSTGYVLPDASCVPMP